MTLCRQLKLSATGNTDSAAIRRLLLSRYGSIPWPCRSSLSFLPSLHLDGVLGAQTRGGNFLGNTVIYRLRGAMVKFCCRMDTRPVWTLYFQRVFCRNYGC